MCVFAFESPQREIRRLTAARVPAREYKAMYQHDVVLYKLDSKHQRPNNIHIQSAKVPTPGKARGVWFDRKVFKGSKAPAERAQPVGGLKVLYEVQQSKRAKPDLRPPQSSGLRYVC